MWIGIPWITNLINLKKLENAIQKSDHTVQMWSNYHYYPSFKNQGVGVKVNNSRKWEWTSTHISDLIPRFECQYPHQG